MNFHDNLTVGYTPDLVVGVWSGNTDYQPMREVNGLSGAAPIWAADAGFAVSGSDAGVFPPMSDFLRAKGLAVRDGYRPENLEPAPDLVVVGNALSRGNPEVEALLDRRLPYCSLPEFLRDASSPDAA